MKPVPLSEFKAGQIPLEHEEQTAFVQYLELAYPSVKFFAVPNGGLRPFKVNDRGQRYSQVAKKLKAMGVRPGVPDLMVIEPRAGYHGVFIEFKRIKGGRLDSDQILWKEFIIGKGYYYFVAEGADMARTLFDKYMNDDLPL